MKALGVVDGVDEERDFAAGMIKVFECFAVDLLGFQGLHEAFGFCVVIRIGWPRHAGCNGAGVKTLPVFVAGILHAAIPCPAMVCLQTMRGGMMDHTVWQGLAGGDGLVKCSNRQRGFDMIFKGPADDLAREGIEHHGEIGKAFAQMHREPALAKAGVMSATQI